MVYFSRFIQLCVCANALWESEGVPYCIERTFAKTTHCVWCVLCVAAGWRTHRACRLDCVREKGERSFLEYQLVLK